MKIEHGRGRNLDLELRLDDVVVLVVPPSRAGIRLDVDRRSACLDVQLDVVELFAGALSNRMDNHFVGGGAGDSSIPRKILQPDRPAARKRHGAVNGFGFFSLRRGWSRNKGKEEERQGGVFHSAWLDGRSGDGVYAHTSSFPV